MKIPCFCVCFVCFFILTAAQCQLPRITAEQCPQQCFAIDQTGSLGPQELVGICGRAACSGITNYSPYPFNIKCVPYSSTEPISYFYLNATRYGSACNWVSGVPLLEGLQAASECNIGGGAGMAFELLPATRNAWVVTVTGYPNLQTISAIVNPWYTCFS
jgi:hypothetical protein